MLRFGGSVLRRLFPSGIPAGASLARASPRVASRPRAKARSKSPHRVSPSASPRQDPPDSPKEPRKPDSRPRSEEPPDLDEVWRDFNRRLSGMFGGKGRQGGGFGGGGGRSGGSGGGFKAPTVKTGPAFGFVALGGVLVWLATGFYIVQEGQSSIVLRFGEFRTTTSAGFNWRLPYPLSHTKS